MKKYIINIVFVLLFAVLFGGCDQPSIGAGRSQKEAGMGRYVEELMPLPVVSGKEEYPVLPFNMGKSVDGSLKMAALSNKDIYFFTSADHGNTWQPLERMKEAYYSVKYAYPGEMAWTPDGSIFFRSYEQSGEEMIPIYMEVDEAGNISTLPLKVPEALNLRVGSMAVNNIPINSNLLVSFQCDENGDIYGVDTDRRLMKFSGITGEILYEFDTYDTSVRRCHIAGNILVAEPGDRFWYYDKDSGERFDIQKTAQEKLAGGDLSNIYDTAFCGGTQENEILFYRDGNIYRYMMDGNALELVVDGSYNSLSAPYLEVYWLETFGDEEILILCKTNDEYQLKRFVYREDVPTVPDKELKVYSLARSKYVEQAVAIFRKNHPDIYVSLEIGMMAEGATKESGIADLLERFEAGGGPDILFTDGIWGVDDSLYSYIEDIGDIIKLVKNETPLFENLLPTDPGVPVYAVPTRIQVYACAGRAAAVDHGLTLEALTAFAKDPQISEIYGFLPTTYEDLLTKLYDVFGSEIFNRDWHIRRDELIEFLTGCNAVMHSDHIEIANPSYMDVDEEDFMRYDSIFAYRFSDLLTDEQRMDYVKLDSVLRFATVWSFKKSLYPDMDFRLMQNSVILTGNIAVNKNSGVKDAAKLFVKEMLSEEIQQIKNGGFPVLISVFDQLQSTPFQGSSYGFGDMGNGEQITVIVERPDEKSFAGLKKVIQTADLSAGMLDIYTKPEYAIKQQKLLNLMLERILDIRHRDFDVEQCADELIQALEATD